MNAVVKDDRAEKKNNVNKYFIEFSVINKVMTDMNLDDEKMKYKSKYK